MANRYKKLLQLTRGISSYEEAINRLETLYLMYDCRFISYYMYRFLKRKLVQSAYLNGVPYLDFMIKGYFSDNDIDSFNKYLIKDKRWFDYD